MHEDDLIPLKTHELLRYKSFASYKTKIVAFEKNKLVIYNLSGNSELFEGVLINMLVGPHHASYHMVLRLPIMSIGFFIKLLRVTCEGKKHFKCISARWYLK